jgi:heat shock protein HtpX
MGMMHPKLRVVVFLCLVNAAWATAAWLTLERSTWLWITPIALSINGLLLTYDQVLTFTKLHSQPVLGQDPWGLLKLVHELSEKFQIATPQVFLIAQPSAQLFCYGKTGKRTRLFITEGALRLLSARELRAVVTFQMCVMNTSYSVLNYWLGATIDLFYRLGRAFEKAFAFVFGWTPPIAATFVSPWTWFLQKVLMRASDFTKLDRAAAARIEHPEDLARALWKMESYAQTQPWAEPWVFAHMCMVSPLGFRHVLKALQIQPPVKSRIKNLIGRYPL